MTIRFAIDDEVEERGTGRLGRVTGVGLGTHHNVCVLWLDGSEYWLSENECYHIEPVNHDPYKTEKEMEIEKGDENGKS